MIDAEDVRLVEDGVQRLIQRFCRGEIASKRLLEDDARSARAAALAEAADDGRKHTGRDGQIVQRMLRVAGFRAKPHECVVILVVAFDQAQQTDQLRERRSIDATTVFLEAVEARAQLLERADSGNADDRNVEVTAADHRLQSWKDLLEGQIAGDPEQHQRRIVRPSYVLLLDVTAEGETHGEYAVLELGLAP